MKNSLINCL